MLAEDAAKEISAARRSGRHPLVFLSFFALLIWILYSYWM